MTTEARTKQAGMALAGSGLLARLAFRRDRIALPASVYVIVALVAGTAYTFRKLYPAAAGREALVMAGQANPALRFLYGELDGDSLGSLTTWRYGIWAGIFTALVAIFVVIRHSRSDEEAGRLELTGSAAVGRGAALAAAVVTAVSASLAIALLLSAVLPLARLPAAGSAALGLAIGGCGLAFTGIAAVAAQLAASARVARGIALGALGAAFMLRGVGDAAGTGGLSWLSWASPLGWIQLTRPFAAERWWVLALPLAAFAAGAGLSFWLAGRAISARACCLTGPGRPLLRRGCGIRSAWPGGCSGARWRAG